MKLQYRTDDVLHYVQNSAVSKPEGYHGHLLLPKLLLLQLLQLFSVK